MILFPDQEIVLEEARQKLRLIKPGARKPRIMIQAPCGFGKTAVAAFIARSVTAHGLPSWFICHKDFLLSQTSQTFDNVGIPYSFMAAGRSMDKSSLAQIGMIGSLKSRSSKVQSPAVCVWDEAHHMPAKTWAAQMDAMPDTIHVGLSATPGGRTDGQGLGAYFDDIVLGPSVEYLIANKRLSDYIYYAPSKPDLSHVHVKMGEYVTAELDEEMTKAKIIGDIVASYRKYADGTRAVYFATSVATSKRYAAAFQNAGVNAIHLDAESTSEERKAGAIAMALGRVKVICNVGLFGEGYDLAAQAGMPVTVETVGLCRPTKSFPLLIQMMMRAMRAKDYPGVILDHAGCFEEHNFLPDDTVNWDLSGARRSSDIPPTYLCDGCGSMLKRGVYQCQHCGCDNSAIIREIRRKAEIEHRMGELERIDRENRIKADAEAKEAEKRKRNIAINSFTTYEEFLSFEKAKGYNKGWARVQWKLRSKGITKRLQAKQRQNLLLL